MIRAFATGDEVGILELYRLVFGLEMAPSLWRWYYGRNSVIIVAECAGRVVGHYAVQPRPFFIGERPVTAGLVIGSMIAPEFRNVSTFVEMARLAYRHCRERSIAFLYAFPNDNVWAVRRRMLDWKPLPSLVALTTSTRALRVTSDGSGIALLTEGQRFPEAPWLGRARPLTIRAADPPEYLDWRLRARPDLEYPTYIHTVDGDLRGYIALKRYERSDVVKGHVVALRVASGAEASSGRALLAAAKAHFAASGVEDVSMWLLPASPLHEVVLAAGLTPEASKGQNFGYLALESGFESALATGASWDITMSDSDVF